MILISTGIIDKNTAELRRLRKLANSTTSGVFPKKLCDGSCGICWCHYLGIPCNYEYKENELLRFCTLNAAYRRIIERKERLYEVYRGKQSDESEECIAGNHSRDEENEEPGKLC